MNRKTKDVIASRAMLSATVFSGLLVFLVAALLLYRSIPIFSMSPIYDLLTSTVWRPSKGQFGLFPFIIGSLTVTGVAMFFSVPISILSSIYLAEYAESKVRSVIKPLIDLLAGIPPVVYGLMGLIVIVPFVYQLASLFNIDSSGYSILAGSIVLAIMVFPLIISISEEIIRTVPENVREASISLGATKWQTVKYAVLKAARPGILAAIILGFSRAIGETIAVLMVVGNVAAIPNSIFDPAYPITALIANKYGEMMSIPLYDSALLFAALVLLAIVLFFNAIARIILQRVERMFI